MQREIADVLETVKRAKERDKACILLIGAGCSVKAGIPSATEFIEIIRKTYPRAHERAEKKTYPHVMAQLSMAERHDLISDCITKAKLNWAHLAIAQLIKHGYVDRVLTVNFDPLVMRACALVGVFPAVYDFAASQNFKADFIARQSVFYLHGQHTGFVVLNTEAEVKRLSEHLGPVFTDSARGHVWIVAGYSGDNDPVFNHLAKIERFDNNLYWICYKDKPPEQHVQDRLLVEGKDCFSVNGFDADDFFVALAQGLGCFPPDFVQTPFTHLDNLLEPVLPYSLPGKNSSLEAIPKQLLRDAIEKIEIPSALALRANDLLLAGDFDKVIEMEADFAKTPIEELGDAIAWAHISLGNELVSQTGDRTDEEAARLWVLAEEKYVAALAINPQHSAGLNGWAIALTGQARTRSGEEAERLWALADEKFSAGLAAKPDDADALYNWGVALADKAKRKTGEEADRLWAAAGEKYSAALAIEPDYSDALNNMGIALHAQARTKSGEEAERLWALGAEKYAAALAITPDKYDAFSNWASGLDDQARMTGGKEADRLWALAGEKYTAALAIKPDDTNSLYNWGAALDAQAATKTGDEAERLLALAREKYAAAAAIAPDLYPEIESDEAEEQDEIP